MNTLSHQTGARQKLRIDLSKYRKQLDFVYDPARFLCFNAGIYSAKTFSGAIRTLRFCTDLGARCGMVVAPTYTMLKDATIPVIQEVAGPVWDNKRYNRSPPMSGYIKQAEIRFRSADKPDNLRGPSLDFIWIDEAAMITHEAWKICLGRLRRGNVARPMWITTTPRGRNWVYDEFIEKVQGNPKRAGRYKLYTASTWDNPFADKEIIEDLKESYSGAFAKQELEGQFVAFEGLVYDTFRREIHIKEPPAELRRVVAGVDWGYSNPAVILVLGIDGDGRIYAIDEWHFRRKLIGDQIAAAKRLKERWNIDHFYCDSSRPDNIREFNLAGLPASGATHKVLEGIKEIQSRLDVAGDGLARYFVSSACPNHISEFESYCWKGKDDAFKDDPEKINDHTMDAARYGVMLLRYPKARYLG